MALRKQIINVLPIRQICQCVADIRVRFKGQYLAVYPKTPDIISTAILDCIEKRPGVGQTQLRNLLYLRGTTKTLQIPGG